MDVRAVKCGILEEKYWVREFIMLTTLEEPSEIQAFCSIKG